MTMTRPGLAKQAAFVLAAGLAVAACGGDDDTGSAATDAGAPVGEDASDVAQEAADDSAASAGDGAGGTLVLGDETITMDSVRCYLEEQPRAGLGGTFEFSIQAQGADAAGVPVVLDITRVRPDPDGGPLGSDEPSDDVKIDFGEPGAPDALSYVGSDPVGTVTVDGDDVSASDVSVMSFEGTGEALDASFDLRCG